MHKFPNAIDRQRSLVLSVADQLLHGPAVPSWTILSPILNQLIPHLGPSLPMLLAQLISAFRVDNGRVGTGP